MMAEICGKEGDRGLLTYTIVLLRRILKPTSS